MDATLSDAEFARGKALLAQRKKNEAREAYLSALRYKKSYDVAGNLGSLELELKLYRDAAEHLAYALRTYGPTGTTPEQLKRARERFEEAKREVTELSISSNVDGAEIQIDGIQVGRAPLDAPVYVEPGEHVVRGVLSGYEGKSVELTAERGASAAVSVELSLVQNAVVPQPPKTEPPERSLIPAIVLGGVAVVGIGVGVGLWAAGDGKRTDAKNLHDEITSANRGCLAGAADFDPRCPDLANLGSSADSLHDAGVGFMVAGGLLGVGAVAAAFFWPVAEEKQGVTVKVAPVVGAARGLMLSGSF